MASIAHQIDRCLATQFLNKEQIDHFKQELGTNSVKRSLRPGGNPTKSLPYLISYGSRKTYFKVLKPFFSFAKQDSGEKLLSRLLTHSIILTTFDSHYKDVSVWTAYTIQAAIKHVFKGALSLGWVKGKCPIDTDLSDRINEHIRTPRFGYPPADALKILTRLSEISSPYALPAEIAYRCGLRESEIAGLRWQDFDWPRNELTLIGKGGRERTVPSPVLWGAHLKELPAGKAIFLPPKRAGVLLLEELFKALQGPSAWRNLVCIDSVRPMPD